MSFQLLLEARQQLAKAVQPCMTHFDHPAPWTVARALPLLPLFFPPGANMREVSMLRGDLATLAIILALVQAQVLRSGRGGLRPLHYDHA
jgi:hypothetical protein